LHERSLHRTPHRTPHRSSFPTSLPTSLPSLLLTSTTFTSTLGEAFTSVVTENHGIQVKVMEGVVVTVNRDLLLLYSPFLRSALSSSPFPDLLFLPNTSLTSLLALTSLLSTGTTTQKATMEEVVEVARELGISMERLVEITWVEANNKGTKSKTKTTKRKREEEERIGPEAVIEKELQGKKEKRVVERMATKDCRDERRTEELVPETIVVTEEQTSVEVATENMDEETSGVGSTASVDDESIESRSVPSLETLSRETAKEGPLEKGAPWLLRCEIKNSKCTDQGKLFSTGHDLRYHYSKHAKAALVTRLETSWPSFHNSSNSCSSCQLIFQSTDKLAFHIGAKHREVDAILLLKGIPLPEEKISSPAPATATEPVSQPRATISSLPVASSTHALPATAPDAATTSTTATTPVSVPASALDPATATASASVPAPGPAPAPASTPPSEPIALSEVNYSLSCEVCDTKTTTLSQLHQHCTNHFLRNIQARFSGLMGPTGKDCLVCGYVSRTKPQLTLHLGCKHGKVNEVLMEQGFKRLPCPVAPNTQRDAQLQKKLLEIVKKELFK